MIEFYTQWGDVAKGSKAEVCKISIRGFKSLRRLQESGLVAQLAEHPAHNRTVGGSIPSEPTKKLKISGLMPVFVLLTINGVFNPALLDRKRAGPHRPREEVFYEDLRNDVYHQTRCTRGREEQPC